MNKIKAIFVVASLCAVLSVMGCGQSNVNEVTDTSTVEKNNDRNNNNGNNDDRNNNIGNSVNNTESKNCFFMCCPFT